MEFHHFHVTLPAGVRGGRREFHVSRKAREIYGVDNDLISLRGPLLLADFTAVQRLAQAMNSRRDVARFPESGITAGDLYAAGLIDEISHLLIEVHRERLGGDIFRRADAFVAREVGGQEMHHTLLTFLSLFPPGALAASGSDVVSYLDASSGEIGNAEIALEELLLLWLENQNQALERMRGLFDDSELRSGSAYLRVIAALRRFFAGKPAVPGGASLIELLLAPLKASPTSLQGQLLYIREHWAPLLGERFPGVLERLLRSLDILMEEQAVRLPGPGPSMVPDLQELRGPAGEAAEYQRFSPDSSWMPHVVLLAKSTYVWLDQLSVRFKREVRRLDQIPDEVLDELASWGFNALWLIGLWERSRASERIKHLSGQRDAVASAYAVYDYQIASDLGGEKAYQNLRDRAWRRGIRLASDMVPNHVGIDGSWVMEHPDWFLQLEQSPFPGYTFDGPDVSSDDRVGIFLEDHYYDHSDAAVVFKRLDRASGDVRYLYHGNDGTSMPWNDTAQLDYLNPEVREAVIQTILRVARMFPIIRFDAAMTLAKRHIRRLWFPEPGAGGAIPSRAVHGGMSAEDFERALPEEFWREVVDRVALEVPDTLLLAEAFWMMEGYFVRTLGMHRVYNSAFMNMLKREDNHSYRQLVKNVLTFDPEVLKRFVNFMSNPDEETAVAQFGKDDKYFGTCVLMSTMPGLPMFGHGQIKGLAEKYGMEFRRARHQETSDPGLLERHRREIFPLLYRRREFAEVKNFLFFDFFTAEGSVNEDVFAYSNRHGARASLVLFNNRFAEARGWLRDSVPFAFGNDDDKHLLQRTIGEGLGARGGEDGYLILREQIAGLEYLRSSDEVMANGLYVELGAFKYQVFVDIREVRVSDEQPYHLLHGRLAGKGTPSMASALLELRLEPCHQAFTRMLEAGASRALPEYRRFLSALRALGNEIDVKAASAAFRTLVAALPALAEDSKRPAPDRTTVIILLAWAAMAAMDDPRLYQELHLVGPLLEQLVKVSPAGEAARHEAIVPLLLRQAPRLLEANPEAYPVVAELLEDEDARSCLQVNEFDGITWFNREGFGLLMTTLLLAGRLARSVRGLDNAPLDRLERELLVAEGESGYRLDALLSALALPDRPEAPEA